MKCFLKIRLSSIEILGFIGLIIWILTLVIRRTGFIDNTTFNLFWFAPNFGGAWVATALIKQFFKPCGSTKSAFHCTFNIKVYLLVCFLVVLLAILNEFAYPINTSGAFDIRDVIATVIAQVFIFIFPIVLKDKCLSYFTE